MAEAEAAVRILMLSWRDPEHPRAGGAEVLTHETLKRLVAAGHEVTWFAAAFPGAAPETEIDGIRVIRQGRAWTVQFRAWRWLRRRLDDYDRVVDQINTLPFMTPWYVPAAQRRFFIMQLAREYWWRESPGLFRLLSPLGYALEPWSLRRYRRTRGVTISESTKDDLVKLGVPARNVAIIPMAITVSPAARLPRKLGSPTVMILGRLTPAKFVEEGITAFAGIQAEHPQARLEIVGRGEPAYRKRLERLVRRRGLRNVRFRGGVGEAEKRKLLRQAHLLLFTSHREGWGLVVNEAAAYGTPTVGYDVPGVRESIGERLQLAPVGDTATLTERALTLLGKPARYDRLRRLAWQRARKMSYDRTARELLKHLAAPGRPKVQPAHVAVNSRIAQQSQHSGIPRFVAATYRWLLRHDRRHRYVFFQTASRRTIGPTEIVRLPANTLGAALFDLWLVNRLARKLPAGSVFHGPSNVLPWRKRKSLRAVVTIHDLSSLVFPEQYGRVFRTYYRIAVGRSLRNADLVTADSEHTKRDIERFYGTASEKIRVVPLGVDETFLKAKRQRRKIRERYFLSVTTHPKRKNLPTVLRAFAESKALRGHVYAIAGIIPPSQVRELAALARELGVGDRVRLLGFVSERELIGLYQHADFFVYPSFYEGFGLPALEAMALGCPVIASDASSLPEVVPDRTWLVDPYSVRSVRRTMEKLAVLRPSARAALIRRNRAFAERFTWAETARKLTSVFDEARRLS